MRPPLSRAGDYRTRLPNSRRDRFSRRHQCISYLRQLGVTISIDDFGTGHSNLGRLLELPVDRIKIDRSFIAGIGRPGNAEKITRSIIVLARSIGATVVAEGVERALQ